MLGGVGQAGTDMWVYATLHQLPLPMRGGRQSMSMHSQNVIMGGHSNSLLQGKEYATCLPVCPTWPLVLSPIHHSSALNMLAEQAGSGGGATKPCHQQEDGIRWTKYPCATYHSGFCGTLCLGLSVLWRHYMYFVYDKLPVLILGVKYLTSGLNHIFFSLHHGAVGEE